MITDMKILNLKVEGFRSLKSIDWSPGDLNVVIGPNAGGKSNLLQLLEMISASARGKLSGFVKEQGGMQPLVWDGQAKSIQIELNTLPIVKSQGEQHDSLIYKLELECLGKTSSYQIEKEILIPENPTAETLLSRTASGGSIINKDGKKVTLRISENESILRVSENESLLSRVGSSISSLIEAPRIDDYQKNLSSWNIYSEFNTGRNAAIRQAVITSYETQVEPDGQNLIPVLHTHYEESRDFKQEINSAMQAAFGDDFEELSFPPAADGRTQLRIRWKSLTTSQSAASLSDGTLRFLYLLAILANPKPPALIAIDEPETGLHPSMLSIIAEYAVEAARKTQVIFTTHSPEMLSAFGQTRPTVTVCEWHDSQTELRVLAGEKLDFWLNKYSLGELYRTGELENMK